MKDIDLQGMWQAEIAEKNLRFDLPLPGDLASALLAAGHIPHPYEERNERDIQWIGKVDWRAWKTFSLSEDDLGPGWLEIDGLDTVAEIYLNKQCIGSSRNMFTRLRLHVDKELKTGENLLEIVFRSPEHYALQKAEELPYPVPCSPYADWGPPHRNMLRKVQCHSGWDWGPVIMTAGVYGNIALHLTRERMEYVTCSTSPVDDSAWELSINAEYYAQSAGKISLNYQLSPPTGADLSATREFEVKQGINVLEHVLRVDTPRLWWPRGYGSQELYELKIQNAETLFHTRIGFRSIEVISEDDDAGRSMYFKVNGRDFYAKGANWIPPDALPSAQSEALYRRLLTSAADANMNMVRLWGGGQYERDIFYDLCDELGLLIWHDMMFSCSLYPATEDFLAEVEVEVTHQLKRLMNHPSIALWCGNNEDVGALTWYEESRKDRDRYLVDYDRLNEGTIGRLVRSIDPGRTWWPSSPSAGPGDYSDCWHDDRKGDMHYWSVWHEGLPFESYYDVIPRFCSEFGFQSLPSLPTVKSFAPESEWNISSPVMLHHQRNNRGNSIILSTISSYFRMPKNFEETLYVSQVQQAFAMQTAVEYWRSMRPTNMGALYWQLNDNWPVASWSSLEHSGRWKVLHYAAARFFAPVCLVIYKKNGNLQVHGLNDRPDPVSGHLLLRLIAFNGEVLQSFNINPVSVNGDSAACLWELPLADLANFSNDSAIVEQAFLHARWENDATGEVDSSIFLTNPRHSYLHKAQITIEAGSEANSFLLSTDRPAFYLFPECDIPGHFSDGSFTLLPGEPRELRFVPENGAEKPVLSTEAIRIHDLRSSYD